MKDPATITAIVAKYFNMQVSEIFQRSRKTEIVRPRQILFYFIKKYTTLSYSKVGSLGSKYISIFDHATVMNSENRIRNLYDSKDSEVYKYINEIKALLNDTPLIGDNETNNLAKENALLKMELQKIREEGISKDLKLLYDTYKLLSDERKERVLIQAETSLKVQNMEHQKLRSQTKNN